MDIPRYHHRSPLDLPEICLQPTDRYHNSRTTSYTSGPSPSRSPYAMAIPNARGSSPPPPPLPPPRRPDLDAQDDGRPLQPDISWQWHNSREKDSWARPSVAPGSSLYGSLCSSEHNSMGDRPGFDRRNSSTSTIKSAGDANATQDPFPRIDEGYASLSGTRFAFSQPRRDDAAMRPLPGFQSLLHDKFENPTANYDNSLLKKLDSRRHKDTSTPPNETTRHFFSSSLNDVDIKGRRYDVVPQLQPLSLPVLTVKSEYVESPVSGWNDTASSVASPKAYLSGGQSPYDHRSPIDRLERTALPYRPSNPSNLKNEDDGSNHSRSSRGSYDQAYVDSEVDFPMEETNGLRRLHIDDRMLRGDGYSPQSAAGQKRRASSPPREDGLPVLHTANSAGDLFRRRESASRSSPAPRLHSNHGSISSTASAPRNNSYASTTASLAPSSITTVSSYGRRSPGGYSPGGPGGLSPGGFPMGGLSPGGISSGGRSPGPHTPGGVSPRTTDDGMDSPYVSPNPHRPMHQRNISFDSRSAVSSRKSSTDMNSHLNHQAGFICECCPKKPKKFETAEELHAHEQEKQYECLYCKNRFKNKNEAERHQNSLHLRRHSWSCAALSNTAAAFHISPIRPNDADTCGYCGEEFSRTGPLDERNVRTASARDWDLRVQHLSEIHKFGECNQAKKFFRADHFRQHLKHSHAGTSGKWTNMLENACMKDEPMPVPRIRDEPVPVPRIREEDES